MWDSTFRLLLDGAPDAMVIVDRRGIVVLVNAQTERLFGYARDELIGRPMELLVPARLRGRHAEQREGYAAAPKVRGMGSGLELYAQRRDGTEFPVEISLSPLPTPEGPLVISAVRDITERKRARQKEVLLNEIHHRVRNNLQVISSLLKLHAERAAGPETREVLADVQQRVRAIALLHEHLHEVPESGEVHLETYASALVSALVRLFPSEAAVTVERSEVRVSLDQALPCGLILNELVTNSLKHGFGGRRPGAARPQVSVRAEALAGWVSLQVVDNGVGFPPAPREGALGLHLVRTLVRQLEGEVSLETDGGARVRVTFAEKTREPG